MDLGLRRRISRLLPNGRTLIVPIDDSLIAGPIAGLGNMGKLAADVDNSRPDAVLGFLGQFQRLEGLLSGGQLILNLTVSSTRSKHVEKRIASSIETGLAIDCAAVAVHVNTTSAGEGEMIAELARTVERGYELGMPVLAIMYPRSVAADGSDENYMQMLTQNREAYAAQVAHAVRIASDLGASVIKTHYTHSIETFGTVVEAANGVPVVVAGGPKIDRQGAVNLAREAMSAGASGISFGRNVFSRTDPRSMISELREIVHDSPLHRVENE